jgi:spore germination protein (amino acid permease)
MKEKLAPIQVSILMYMIQSGIILFSLPRLTAEAFGTNGWLGIIIVYMIVNLNLVLIWYVFKAGNGRSMFELMSYIPKWIRLPLSMILSGVWLGLGTLVMVRYIMLLKLLFYPNVSILLMMVMGLAMCYLLLQNGLYHIAKSTVVLFYLTAWTTLLLFFHLKDFSFVRLTPFIFQGEKDILNGGFGVYTSLLGYELSILFLHLVEKKKLKAILVGNTITSIIYLSVCFISFGFFSFEMLLQDLYPVVTLLEYISFPVLERVENLIFSLFGLKMLVTTVMYLWASKEVLEHQYPRIKPKYVLFTVLLISFIVSFFPKIAREADIMLNYLSYAGTGIAYFLPVLLLIIIFYSKYIKKENVS